jgi:hypothetical protein
MSHPVVTTTPDILFVRNQKCAFVNYGLFVVQTAHNSRMIEVAKVTAWCIKRRVHATHALYLFGSDHSVETCHKLCTCHRQAGWTQIEYQNKHYDIDQKEKGT